MSDPGLAHLRLSSVYSLGGRPPQSNYPPDTVHNPIRDHPNVEQSKPNKGCIFKDRLHHNSGEYAFKVFPPILHHVEVNVQCQAIVKVHGVFPSSVAVTHSFTRFNFTGLGWRQRGHLFRHSLQSELTRQGIFALP